MRLLVLALLAALLFTAVPFAEVQAGAGGIADRLRGERIGESADEAAPRAVAPSRTGKGKPDGVPASAAAELEAELAKIRALAPEIASPDADAPVTLTPAGSAKDALADTLAGERRELFRARFAEGVAGFDAGAFAAARGTFLALHADFPWAGKPVYFAILCLKAEGETARALAAARELRELLAFRARRDALRAELETTAADTAETELPAAKRKRLSAKADKILADIERLRPDIARLPEKGEEPKDAEGEAADRLKAWVRYLRRDDARDGLAKAHELFDAGRFEEAYLAFDAVRQAHPGSLRAVYGMALCKRKAGDAEAAVAVAADCLALLRTRRSLHGQMDELDDALEADAKNGTADPADTAPPSGSLKFRIASFNIFHGIDAAWEERLARSVRVLKGNGIDIVGFQEMRQNQMRRFLKDDMGGDVYDLYPPRFKGPREGSVSVNGIAWNRARFALVSAKEIPFKYFGGAKPKFPQLRLRDRASGREFYVLNTHDPAFPENAKLRYENAHLYAKHLSDLAKEGLPVFFTGDFNSGYRVRSEGNTTWGGERNNLTYCILTRDGKYWDAYDAAANRRGEGPSSDNANSVDHIFLSEWIKVTRYWKAEGGKKKNGSDVHSTIMAAVEIPARGK